MLGRSLRFTSTMTRDDQQWYHSSQPESGIHQTTEEITMPERRSPRHFSSYFTEKSRQKYLFYLACLVYVIGVTIIVLLEPFITIPCDNEESGQQSDLKFKNVLFYYSPCLEYRYPHLLYLTRFECQQGRNLLMAVFLGSLIGYERRSSDRPAGIRTMALVSLGSALFTINSTFAFLDGPMSWDASRVSAAIPSGVGFLGAGLIIKATEKDPFTGESHHLVQGITTAAATWLSAAVGLACGGGLYFVASFSTAVNLVLLRFGPRLTDMGVENNMPEGGADLQSLSEEDFDRESGKPLSFSVPKKIYGGTNETSPLTAQRHQLSTHQMKMLSTRGSTRSRPSLL
ncbi:hypothetical protein HJC23_011613 [Cyclotella cryptica]|uniref:MgtC/SapB/SrpB/YhiD N-terminal domain-containing protein n=1 Tax=Cyclotella cryptica TaxID=29204 RepID=A0ABD3QRH9_9STRA